MRHEGNEFAARRQMREIGKRHVGIADKTRETKDVVLRKAQGARSKGADLTSGAVNAVTDDQGSVKPLVPKAAVVVAAAVLVGILIWRRRR